MSIKIEKNEKNLNNNVIDLIPELQNKDIEKIKKVFKHKVIDNPIELKCVENLEKHYAFDLDYEKNSLLNSSTIPTVSLYSGKTEEHSRIFGLIHADHLVNHVLESASMHDTTTSMGNLIEVIKEEEGWSEEEREALNTLIEDCKQIRQSSITYSFIEFEVKNIKCKENFDNSIDSRDLKRKEMKRKEAEIFQKEAKKLSEKIFDMKPNAHQPLFGGYHDPSGGHSMLYEFIKNEDDTYDILVFNTEAGTAGGHHDVLFFNNKRKLLPIARYAKVTKEELFFSKEKEKIKLARFQKILECFEKPLIDHTVESGAKDVYAIFSDLEKHRVVGDQSLIGFMTAQRSGSCSWRVLLPYACYRLTNHIKDPKKKLLLSRKLKQRIQLYSLIGFYREFKDKDFKKPEFKQSLHLLEEAARALLRTTAKLYQIEEEKSVLSEQEAQESYATAKELLKVIEGIKKELRDNPEQVSEIVQLEKHQVSQSEKIEREKLLLSLEPPEEPPSGDLSINSSINVWGKIQPNNLLETLQKAANQLESPNEFEALGVRISIEKLLLDIPFPDPKRNSSDYWQKIPQEDLNSCLETLQTIMQRYVPMASIPNVNFPTQQNAIFSLYAMIHTMAIRIDSLKKRGPKLTDYGIYFPIDRLEEDRYTIFHNEESYKRRNEILNYFRNNSTNKNLFNFGKEIKIDDHHVDTYECEYYKQVWESDSKFEEIYKQREEDDNPPFPLVGFRPRNGGPFQNTKEKLREKTKVIAQLYMETNSESTYLCDSPYKYLLALKEAAAFSQYILLRRREDNHGWQKPFVPEIHDLFSTSDKEIIPITWINSKSLSQEGYFKDFYAKQTCRKMHRELPEKKKYEDKDGWTSYETIPHVLSLFVEKNEQMRRLYETTSSEGNSLDKKIGEEIPLLGQEFARSCCEPDLEPTLILGTALDHCETFDQPDSQTAFDLLFYRNIIHKKSNTKEDRYPLLEQLSKKNSAEALFGQAKELIDKGIEIFDTLRPSGAPNIYACLFFIRLAIRLRCLAGNKEAKLDFDEKALLRKWLSAEIETTAEEKAALHLHLAASYMHSPPENLTDEAIAEILASWAVVQQEPQDKKWQDPSLQEQLSQWFYHKLSPLLQNRLKDSTLCNNSLNAILKASGFENESGINWENHHPCYRLPLKGSDFWEINILTGVLRNQQGILKSAEGSYRKHKEYQRLFQGKEYKTKTANTVHFFESTDYGLIRCFLKEVDFDKKFILQRQSSEGKWLQYQSPEHIKETFGNDLAYSLIDDYSHWIPLDNDCDIALEIRDLTNGRLTAVMKKDGTVLICGSKESDFLSTAITVRKENSEESPLIDRLSFFEQKNFLLFTSDLNPKKEGQFKVQLPRYLSLDGNPLSFECASKEDSQLQWNENSNLILSPSQSFQHKALCSIPNFLSLIDKKSNQIKKLLVPLQQLVSDGPCFSSQLKLNLSGSNNEKDSDNIRQKGRFRYLEFDWKNGEASPQNTEGKLFLSYLYLLHRDYAKSLELLNQVTSTDKVSKQSLELIHWIVNSNSHLTDKSPKAASIRLHAAHWLIRAATRPDFSHERPFPWVNYELKKQETAEEKENRAKTKEELLEHELINDHNIYIDGCNHVEKEIALSIKQHKVLSQHFPALRGYSYINYLEKKIYNPDLNFQESRLSGELPLGIDYCNTEHYWLKPMWEELGKIKDDTSEKPFLFFGNESRMIDYVDSFPGLYRMAREGTDTEKKYVEFFLRNTTSKNVLFQFLYYGLKHPNQFPSLEKNSDMDRWVKKMTSDGANKPKGPSFFPLKTNSKSNEEENFNLLAPPPAKEKNEPINLALNLEEYENISIKKLANAYLEKPLKNKEKKEVKFENKINKEKKESDIVPAVDEELKQFQIDLEEGRKQNEEERVEYKIKGKQILKLENLKNDLDGIINSAKETIKPLEEKMIQLANKGAESKRLHKRDLSLKSGKAVQEIALSDLIDLFLAKDGEQFKKANPYLSAEEISLLFQWTGEFLLLSTQLQQAERAKKRLEEVIDAGGDLLTRNYRIQQLGDELSSSCVYALPKNNLVNLEFLVFEYRSNMRIREKQYDLILKMMETDEKGNYKNCVIQLIMGGGKTSVLAALLGFFAAKPGRLSMFLVPGALFESVKANLKKNQKQNFGQKVNPIHLERSQFTLENLLWLKGELEKAIDKKQMVLAEAEMIQALSLEFLHLMKCYKNAVDKTKTVELQQRITALKDILKIFKEKTDALGDEVDQLLHVLKAVNFPEGEEMHVKREYIDLSKEIYLTLMNDTIQVEEKKCSLKDFVNLKNNNQSLVSEEDYHTIVKKYIVEHLTNYAPFKLKKEHSNSFKRYLKNEIGSNLAAYVQNPKAAKNLTNQEKEDLEFLVWLKEQANTSIETDPEASKRADLIALARLLLNKIMPGTLAKNGNRHYGRGSTVKVVPYLGVDTPATTHFGNYYEAICYHFQTAILSGVHESHLTELAQSMNSSAVHSSRTKNIAFDKTAEAIAFEKITSVKLHLIDRPGNLKKAVDYVNRSIESVMEFESQTIESVITYHSQRLNSTPQMLVDLFSTFRAFSGTPWNDSTYHPSIETILDKGTEGKIAHELLKRESEKKEEDKNSSLIHKVDSTKPQELLKSVTENHPDKDRIRGIIDVGGIFKGTINLDVAKEILKFYEKDLKVNAVVFFGRTEGQSTPDTPFMLKKGISEPIPLSGTQEEAIQAKGIPVKEIFFYYDERHTTGTDFVQSPDAINLLTIDEMLLKRSFNQGALRLRQLFYGQDLEYVIHKETAKSLINEGETVSDLILEGIRKQALCKENHTKRSYFEQIDNIVKQKALKGLLEANTIEAMNTIFTTYETTLINEVEASPYKQYGSLEREEDTLEVLKSYVENYKKSYKDQEINEGLDTALKRAENSKFLPKKMTTTSQGLTGQGEELQIFQETQTSVQTETNNQVELNEELLNELLLYSQTGQTEMRTENEWSLQDAALLIEEGIKNENLEKLKLPDLFDPKLGFGNYPVPYGKIFDSTIFATENFRLTYNQTVSVFHHAQKPAKQILFILRNGNMEAHLLSLHEAVFFKKWLEEQYASNKCSNVWLAHSNGTTFCKNPIASLDRNNPAVKSVLIQVNFFNGNVQYLDENKKETKEWLKTDLALKTRFLRIRVEKDKKQRTILYNSDLFSPTLPVTKKDCGGSNSGSEPVRTWLAHRLLKVHKSRMGILGKIGVAVYIPFAFIAAFFSALASALLVIVPFVNLIFWLRRRVRFFNQVWHLATAPLYDVAYLTRWLRGLEPKIA